MHSPGIPWTGACQVPLSMEFSRQEYWSGLPFPSSGDLPDRGIEPRSLPCRQILYHLSHQGSPYVCVHMRNHHQTPDSVWDIHPYEIHIFFRIAVILLLGGGHSNPLQYSYLENSMDRGVWQATVHGVSKIQT